MNNDKKKRSVHNSVHIQYFSSIDSKPADGSPCIVSYVFPWVCRLLAISFYQDSYSRLYHFAFPPNNPYTILDSSFLHLHFSCTFLIILQTFLSPSSATSKSLISTTPLSNQLPCSTSPTMVCLETFSNPPFYCSLIRHTNHYLCQSAVANKYLRSSTS